MKEIRGAQALQYAREAGIRFDIDEAFIREAEGEMRGEPTPMLMVVDLILESTGRKYAPREITPGDEVFDFLVNRYGDRWIYVALEGVNPAGEEARTLQLFRGLLEGPEPFPGGDVQELFGSYPPPLLYETGYPRSADLNLLFHAAVRLSEKGLLMSVGDREPLPMGGKQSYGRQRFFVPADVQVTLAGVLCDGCRRERLTTQLNLHPECSKRLRKALLKTVPKS